MPDVFGAAWETLRGDTAFPPRSSIMYRSLDHRRLAVILLAVAVTPAKAIEYTFTLVDAFNPSYGLRECYIYDINDQNE